MVRSSSSRLLTILTGRLTFFESRAQTCWLLTCCRLPKPPPMVGLMIWMRLSGRSRSSERIRRSWKGVWVVAHTVKYPSRV